MERNQIHKQMTAGKFNEERKFELEVGRRNWKETELPETDEESMVVQQTELSNTDELGEGVVHIKGRRSTTVYLHVPHNG